MVAVSPIDADSGRLRTVLHGHSRPVWSVAFSPDERVLATARKDGRVHLWDVPTGKLIRQLQAGTHAAAVRFTPDGKALIVSNDNMQRTFDVVTGREVSVTGN